MKVDDAVALLTEELGRYPTPAQIAERIGATTEEVLESLEASHARRTLSLDAPRIADEESAPTIETVASSEPGYERVEAALASKAAAVAPASQSIVRAPTSPMTAPRRVLGSIGKPCGCVRAATGVGVDVAAGGVALGVACAGAVGSGEGVRSGGG